jgi:GntR family transcriptional regulator, arabinose operon transcriptional repressor
MDKPKYQILKEYIINLIKTKELTNGEKIFSENELAEKFDISRHTVRQAIGELVAEGWIYREQGKGTFVDKNSSEKLIVPKMIGVITTYINDYIFPSIIRGIDSVLSTEGYNIILSCTYNQHEKERVCLDNMKNQNLAGLIVEPTKSALPNPNLDLYRELIKNGVKVLFIHGSYNDFDSSHVVEDDIEAGYLATRYLLNLGHTKIGGIFKMDDIQGHLRFAGFQKAYKEIGLSFPDARIFWFNTDEVDNKFENGGNDRFSAHLSDCSAVVCYNDEISVKVINTLRGKGLGVPENISLVSFDDSALASSSEIKLTSVAHPKEQLGIEAGKSILELIKKNEKYYQVKMQPELIIRGSTKKYEGMI